MEERKGDWFQTFTGKIFYALDPREEEIDIRDIAHSLSLSCRFQGHCYYFYSIGEHCIRTKMIAMSLLVNMGANTVDINPAEVAFWSLFHDAAESYIGDINAPLKANMTQYKDVEDNILSVIGKKYGFSYPMSDKVAEIVYKADKIMLATELRDILTTAPKAWDNDEKPSEDMVIVPYSPQEVERIFLGEYYNITKRIPQLQKMKQQAQQIPRTQPGFVGAEGGFKMAKVEERTE